MEDKEITYIDRRNGRRHSMNAKAAAIFEDSPSRRHYELAIDSPPAAKPAPREQVSKPDEDSSRSRGTKSETKAEAKSDPKPEAKAESKPADEPKPAEIKTPITKTNDDRKS
jgi:hypothetical protein